MQKTQLTLNFPKPISNLSNKAQLDDNKDGKGKKTTTYNPDIPTDGFPIFPIDQYDVPM